MDPQTRTTFQPCRTARAPRSETAGVPHEGGDLAAFLDSEAVRYTAQLTRYAHLARQLGPQPVRAGLYFPLLAAWREVDVG
jgi:hypothetical protein